MEISSTTNSSCALRWNEENSLHWETFWPSTHSSHPPQLCGSGLQRAVTGIYWMTFICWLAPARQSVLSSLNQEPSFSTPRTIILSNLTSAQMLKHNWTKTWPAIALYKRKGLGIHETENQNKISRDYSIAILKLAGWSQYQNLNYFTRILL